MRVRKNNALLANARVLRKSMTPQERRLWYCFLRTYPIKFYKQRIIDNYIVDFYCAQAKLVIEVDGSQHYTADGQYSDANRSAIIEKYGLSVIRFSNREINTQFADVCATIHAYIQSTSIKE